MKMIFRIAKAELLNLFYSPVAWLVIIFYFITCGLGFTEPMDKYYSVQKLFLQGDPNWIGFSVNGLSAELTGKVLQQLVTNLFLFIPLLTMGVINREVNSGSMKLLYSSPIRTRDIVLGKYLGLVVLVILLILIISIFLVTTVLIVQNPEIYKYFGALLGAFLVANAFISIGLFISCTTNYQIVAGVITFVVFFILSSISGLWQQYDFVRDLTYFLSISGRASYLLGGLISTRDLCYFILITVLFLGFALIKLKSTQESKPWTVAFTRYIVLFVTVLALGYLTSRPGKVGYWDLTRNQVNTIHPRTQGVLEEMDGSPLTITLYTNLFDQKAPYGLPQNRNAYIWDVWEKYRRFYPNMNYKYVYYYDAQPGDSSLYRMHPNKNIHQIAEKVAKELGIRTTIFLKPEEIRKQIDFGDEARRLTMQLEYKGRKRWLRTYQDAGVWPSQENVSGTIRRLVRDSIPKILFTSGHYERSPYKTGERDYGGDVTSRSARSSLINMGVDADTISLKTDNIPAETPCLVIADPRSMLDTIEQQKINAYLQKGGNAIILAEVKKQQLLNPILNTIGVNADNGTVVQPNSHEMPHILNALLTNAGGYLSGSMKLSQFQNKVAPYVRAQVEGAANVSYKEIDGFKIEPIIEYRGNQSAWIENGTLVVDSAAPVFSAAEGDVKLDKYVLAIKMTRNVGSKEQRIIVAGDADMLTQRRNVDMENTFYSWGINNEYPVYVSYPVPRDTLFSASPGTIKTIRWVYMYLVPALLLVAAIVLLVRRKRK